MIVKGHDPPAVGQRARHLFKFFFSSSLVKRSGSDDDDLKEQKKKNTGGGEGVTEERESEREGKRWRVKRRARGER